LPTDDTKGGYHETGGVWGYRPDSSLVVATAVPGPYCVPGPGKVCDYYMTVQDQDEWSTIVTSGVIGQMKLQNFLRR
jgi:hypothetical protein